MKNNNAGFTLVELLVTIILLALVAGIGAYSITSIMERSKEENYNILIKNIQSAAETYYQECKYSWDEVVSMLNNDEDAAYDLCDYDVSLGELVEFGYLKGNSKKNDNTYAIVNPLDNSDISRCEINVTFDGKIETKFNNNFCPSKTK